MILVAPMLLYAQMVTERRAGWVSLDIGLILMAAACYDPRAAVEVWANMAEAAGAGPPEILSTHPGHGRRIEALGGWMDEALEAQDAANCPTEPQSSLGDSA